MTSNVPRLLAIASLAAILGGVAAAAPAGATPSQSQNPTLTLIVPRSASDGVRYGSKVRLSGRLVSSGAGVSGVPVRVEQARYPDFGRFGGAIETRTGADGNYSVVVYPVRNTSYRASLAGSASTVSPTRLIYAYARIGLPSYTVSGLHLAVQASVRAPQPRVLNGHLISFYYREQGQRHMTLGGSGPMRPSGSEVDTARASFDLPASKHRFRFFITACMHTIPGMGRPQPACGRRTLPL